MRVAVIPARGGSRRIPRKNIRPFHGRPIIAYSIAAAQYSELFDAVYVSTDDSEIADVALDYGAFVILRPLHLAEDHIGTQEVMRHALKGLGAEEACCIYATAPLLTPEDLRRGLVVMQSTDRYSLVVGQFYWGRSEWFLGHRSLSEGTDIWVGDRNIDINTPEDWEKAEEMYAAPHKEAA